MPSVAPCDNLVGTFDDPVKFDDDWYLASGNGTIAVDNGEAAIHLAPGDGASFASTHPDFDFNGCGIWVELTEVATASNVMTRLSIGTPFSMSHYSVGVINQNFEVHVSSTAVFSIPYVAAEMRHVRIREEGGKVYFGHSTDARCWKEVFNVPSTASGMLEGRISVAHVPNGPGSAADGRFDNYCVQPP